MAASLVIEINSGKLRGIVEDNVSGGSYIAFKGIPFAEPPVGVRRFRNPEAVKPWNGIKDATKYSAACYQFDSKQNRYRGSEDCLYLNVFAPNLELTKLKPVLVWIHGGAFSKGSANDDEFAPDYFMNHDVIIVTINYRLGCLGFLDVGDNSAAGNYGLWDQILALQWVKENISAFGGDCNNVTIFGMSAGAISIHCLTLSSEAKELFHKAILMSGVATISAMKALVPPKQIALRLAQLLGTTLTDPEELLEYLRTVEVQQLIAAQGQVLTERENRLSIVPFAPGDDSSLANEVFVDSIFANSMQDEIQRGIQVPCIISHTSHECLAFADVVEIGSDLGDYVNPLFLEKLKEKNLIAEEVFKYYVDSENIRPDNIPGFVDLMTDSLMKSAIHDILEIQGEHCKVPTYYYEFTFDSRKTLAKVRLDNDLPGAAHVDDLSFIFHHKALDALGLDALCLDEEHNLMIQRMTTLLVNFARTGNPTPETSELIPILWKPIDNAQQYNCLKINNELVMDVNENYYRQLAKEINAFKK